MSIKQAIGYVGAFVGLASAGFTLNAHALEKTASVAADIAMRTQIIGGVSDFQMYAAISGAVAATLAAITATL